jgi:glycerophosphoryl diester phosphodiesterase
MFSYAPFRRRQAPTVVGGGASGSTRHTPGVTFAHPYLAGSGDGGKPLAFAHRGGAAAGDENTLAAFQRAVDLGYRYLETDVHATRDGVAVVFHDRTTDRMLGRPGRIEDLSYADLQSVRMNGATVVPRLDDVLSIWPDRFINIDVKAELAVGPTVDAVRRTRAIDRILLASFSERRVARLRALAGPGVATSLGMSGVARLWTSSRVGRGGARAAAHAVAAQTPLRVRGVQFTDRRLIDHAHRLGLAVHVWTVDDPDDIRALLDAGVDGIMTDHIQVLRDVYAERGLWPV